MKIRNLLILIMVAFSNNVFAQNNINLMPFPQDVLKKEGQLIVSGNWNMYYKGEYSPMIQEAMGRFVTRFKNASSKKLQIIDKAENIKIQINKITINDLGIDNKEGYKLNIDSIIIINAATDEGILYALESLNQLLSVYKEGVGFPKVSIQDYPTYAWRGMMVDVARHFIPMDMMKRNVDAMAAVKLNTLHIHISDDEGFRIESKKYPQLHLKGSNGEFYTQAEIIDFIKYCKLRGIEVYAEFDLPGHSQSWFAGYPELAAEKKSYTPGPRFKIDGDKPVNLMSLVQMINTTPTPSLDVSAEATYIFLDNLTKEMKPLFSKAYMHMGLDENNGVAWMRNPKIVSFMQTKGMKTHQDLQNYFAEKYSNII